MYRNKDLQNTGGSDFGIGTWSLALTFGSSFGLCYREDRHHYGLPGSGVSSMMTLKASPMVPLTWNPTMKISMVIEKKPKYKSSFDPACFLDDKSTGSSPRLFDLHRWKMKSPEIWYGTLVPCKLRTLSRLLRPCNIFLSKKHTKVVFILRAGLFQT